jgi:hypothetical protein
VIVFQLNNPFGHPNHEWPSNKILKNKTHVIKALFNHELIMNLNHMYITKFDMM